MKTLFAIIILLIVVKIMNKPNPSSGGGGPSIVIDTTASPLNIIKPKALFSSLSSDIPVPFLFFIRLYLIFLYCKYQNIKNNIIIIYIT